MVRISTTAAAAAAAAALCDLTYQLLMTIIIQPQVQSSGARLRGPSYSSDQFSEV